MKLKIEKTILIASLVLLWVGGIVFTMHHLGMLKK
jgi:hypothetical protein